MVISSHVLDFMAGTVAGGVYEELIGQKSSAFALRPIYGFGAALATPSFLFNWVLAGLIEGVGGYLFDTSGQSWDYRSYGPGTVHWNPAISALYAAAMTLYARLVRRPLENRQRTVVLVFAVMVMIAIWRKQNEQTN